MATTACAGSCGRCLILLATYNERPNIDALLDAILALPIQADILVVDDNSPDGTALSVAARAASTDRLQLVVRQAQAGVGSAHRLGWVYARRLGYRILVTLDADLSHDPCDIPRLLSEIDRGADFVIGSRFIKGGRLDSRGLRLFASRSANWLARYLLWLLLHEYTNSYRAARLERVPPGLIETIDQDGYAFFMIAVVRIARAGLNIAEVPIHFRERASGRSKLPRWEIFRGIINLIRLAIDRRAYSPSSLLVDPLQESSGSGQSDRTGAASGNQ
jgi:dolichol-phosphate mannosyltransferase